MLRRILCVDDDSRILQAFERQFRRQFDLQTALGPQEGLKALADDGPFAVVVSDLKMPGMNGIEFLAVVRRSAPDTVRVMLTGDADLNAAIAAVNEGKIFQFLNKPCPSDKFARTLESALEQHRVLTAEREVLEQTLRGSIGVLSEILSLVNPPAFSRTYRVRRYVQHMAAKLNLPDEWKYELAAMLCQIGCVTVPPEILDKHDRRLPLNAEEEAILASHTRVGHDLLEKIPRLQDVAQMVGRQRSSWSANHGLPEPVRIGAHLLKIALDFDERIMRGGSPTDTVLEMLQLKEYNPAFVTALQQIQIDESNRETRLVSLAQLNTHMIINADVYAKNRLLLLAKGQEVTDSAIARLRSFAITVGIVEPISVIMSMADGLSEGEIDPARKPN